jgi:hypothetical protein
MLGLPFPSAVFMRTATPIVDLSLRSSSLVSRPSTLLRTVTLSNGETYLAIKDETYSFSTPRFTQSTGRVIYEQTVIKDLK